MLLITRDMCRAHPRSVRLALWKVPLLNSFNDFGLIEPILRALAQENYTTPTPIQAQTIAPALAGRDIVGIAQTGTGKTAAFALPILHQLAAAPRRPERKTCRVLVLSPTRELSGQILDSFNAYGRHLGLATTLAIGGVPMGRQVRALMNGVDVLVATPGRLLDLVHSNALRLNQVGFLVLDEADRMLDMGFIHDIRKIVAKIPTERQTLFFSATMPQQIAELARQMLRDPVKVAVTPAATTVEKVAQRVIHVDRAGKAAMLADLLRTETIDRSLVFTRTKHGADKVVRGLVKSGIAAQAIHGNKSQNQRERVLAEFRAGKIRTLVATDIAARGIDVDGISHVINYDLPNEPESYVHRIGRTARAGATGIAISLVDREEVPYLRAIEKLIRLTIAAQGHAPRPQPAGDRAKHARRVDNRPHGHHATHKHGTKGRPDAGSGGRSGQPNRDHHRSHRKSNARNGAPVYGERPSAPARQPHGRGDAAQHAPQGGAQQGGAQEGIAGVGFMRRPVPRRDDAGRSPR
jgi:ATP-dependent RNA helicase RhlE